MNQLEAHATDPLVASIDQLKLNKQTASMYLFIRSN